MSLNFGLSDPFLMIRLGRWGFGRKTAQVKHRSCLIISRICNIIHGAANVLRSKATMNTPAVKQVGFITPAG